MPQTIITDSPAEAAALLNSGCIVAFPTETVYGLGGLITRPDSIERIFAAKGRPQDNPLIVHVAEPEQIGLVALDPSADARILINHFMPGPLTVILKKRPSVPDSITAGLANVGVRCPANPLSRALLERASAPVAAPSANRSGLPSATEWSAVATDLDGRIDAILRGPATTFGLESTIVDCTGKVPLLLRAGSITLETLRSVLPSVMLPTAAGTEEMVKCPGTKYPHYAPKASITLYHEGFPEVLPPHAAVIGTSLPPLPPSTLHCHCRTLEDYGHKLFSFFRKCDNAGITHIFCEFPEEQGIGRAIRDRLLRAAGAK